MNKKELIQKITKKKEFSQLPKKDVEMAFSHFEKRQVSDEEKIRLTRGLLHNVFGAFGSRKLLTLKDKDPEWFLRKHLSTRERLSSYREVYRIILKGLDKEISIIDLGAGVNGFSYNYFKNLGFDVDYVGIEAIGQLVDLMNFYFKKEKLKGKALHMSLFDLEKLKKIIRETEKPRIIFLFKTVDSLETLERNYSKKLLSEVVPLTDRVIVSLATESMAKRKKFRAKRKWIFDFIKENFRILDDFETGGERFVVFRKR